MEVMKLLSLVNSFLCGALLIIGAAVGVMAPEKWSDMHSLAITGCIVAGIGSLISYLVSEY
jgi:hypothetical protein